MTDIIIIFGLLIITLSNFALLLHNNKNNRKKGDKK